MYSFIARNVMAPILDLSRGTRTMECLRELEESQWWPREKLLQLQDNRLRKLVRHAYDNVPYYHCLFSERGLTPKDVQSSSDLAKLPILTKSQIRTQSHELTAGNITDKQRVRLVTGGSTGQPLQFYRSREDQLSWSYAASQRAMGWTGFKLGNKLIRLAGIRPYNSVRKQISEAGKRFFERVMFLDAKVIAAGTLPRFAEKMARFQPDFIWGYPSAVELVARFLKETGCSAVKPRAVITGAEQLYDRQRELFSSVFGCDTFSNYSSWEAHSIAAECQYHYGFHISAENIIVEVVDDQGNPVREGQEGSVVITNLHNFAMPFIRYNLGDLAVFTNHQCTCGRGLPLLKQISGRTVDIIRTRSGKNITGTALINLFMNPPGVVQFQFVQLSYENIVIKLVMDKEYSRGDWDNIAVQVKDRFVSIIGPDLNIDVEFVDTIPLTESGKHMAVISHLNRASGPPAA